jgi:putative tricarboxylic transport membrane protein
VDWRPNQPLEIVAGTPPGGGLDRTARMLLKTLEAHRLLDVPAHVKNVAGDGARNAWRYMDERRGDPHVVSISHPNLTTDRLVGIAAFDHRDYTPIAMLYTEYIAFAIHADAPLRDGAGLIWSLQKFADQTRVALSTARGNPNHIALARLAAHAGADPKAPVVRVFDSALLAVADVVGAWRGVTGAHGIGQPHVRFWEETLRAAIATPTWQEELEREGLSATYTDGAALQHFLEDERVEMAAALQELGLLRPAEA